MEDSVALKRSLYHLHGLGVWAVEETGLSDCVSLYFIYPLKRTRVMEY